MYTVPGHLPDYDSYQAHYGIIEATKEFHQWLAVLLHIPNH